MKKILLTVTMIGVLGSLAYAKDATKGQNGVLCGAGIGIDAAVYSLNSSLSSDGVYLTMGTSYSNISTLTIKAPFSVSAPTIVPAEASGYYDACVTVTQN